MVLEISVQFMKPEPPAVIAEPEEGPKVHKQPKPNPHDLFTVHVDSTRILTVSTAHEITAGKWLTELLKSTSSNFKPLNPNPSFKPDAIFVGLSVDMDGGSEDMPFEELFTLCVGSHCLMFHHQQPEYYPLPKAVKAFFDNPRVVVFGRDMADVARKLKKLNNIEIRNAVDRNQLAIRGMNRDDLDLGRYDLDRQAMTVLGKHYDVIRPEEKLDDWWSNSCYNPDYIFCNLRFSKKKVKFSTVDTYLSVLVDRHRAGGGHSRCSVLRRRREEEEGHQKEPVSNLVVIWSGINLWANWLISGFNS